MFTESFFNILLNLDADWIVERVATDVKLGEVVIQVKCLLKEVEDVETGELCPVYDHAPERKWRHLDTLQYKTFICCSL
jgi:transposase